MPGWERDRECRGSDRNCGNADPLDQLTLLKVMHRLTEITGEEHYAGFALLLYERARRSQSEGLRNRYHQAALDTAEVYMSITPEVQWSVWGVNTAHAIELMMVAYELTGNAAYLHRAGHFGRLAVDQFLDEASPLPKITSHDDFYEIESVTAPSTDVWMLTVLELNGRLVELDDPPKHPARIETGIDLTTLGNTTVTGAPADAWQAQMKRALSEHRGAVWDCTTLGKPSASVALAYGKGGEKTLFLSRRTEGFASSKGLPVDSLGLIASDFINKIPSLEEAESFNGFYRRRLSGKHREPSTATYGGFKDVLDQAGLLLVNHGRQAAKVTVAATLHDSWDDKDTKDYRGTLQPGFNQVTSILCGHSHSHDGNEDRIQYQASLTHAHTSFCISWHCDHCLIDFRCRGRPSQVGPVGCGGLDAVLEIFTG